MIFFHWIIWNQCENGETAKGLFENIISVGGEMSPGVFVLEADSISIAKPLL